MLEESDSFHEHLQNIRKTIYKYKKEAARAIGIPYTTYISYEKGTTPSIENIVKIKEGFNISFEKLFKPFLKKVKADTELDNFLNRIKRICRDEKATRILASQLKLIEDCFNIESPRTDREEGEGADTV